MADETNAEVVEKSSFDFKIVLIGILIFLVAMGASYLLMRSLMAPLMPRDENDGEQMLTGNLVEVGEFMTNINDVAGTRFLKVEVTVEVTAEDEEAQEAITQFMPVVRDSILTILSSKTVADLDVRNRNNLKAEIKNDLNSKMGSGLIQNIYFTSFIMQ